MDYLKSRFPLGFIGARLAEYGIIPLKDNHGNSIKGRSLTCAGQPALFLDNHELTALQATISVFAMRAFKPNGEIALGEIESPLQTMCKARESSRQIR